MHDEPPPLLLPRLLLLPPPPPSVCAVLRYLGAAFRGVRGSFYPTVGIDSACPVKINFGSEPFSFDLAASLREGGQEASARKVRERVVPGGMYQN